MNKKDIIEIIKRRTAIFIRHDASGYLREQPETLVEDFAQAIMDDINEAEDVEVIRCEQCKHYNYNLGRSFCGRHSFWYEGCVVDVGGNDFCSRAERR